MICSICSVKCLLCRICSVYLCVAWYGISCMYASCMIFERGNMFTQTYISMTWHYLQWDLTPSHVKHVPAANYNSLNNLLTPLNNLLTRPCSYYNSLRNHFQPLVEGAILADFPNLPLASPKPQPPELDFAVQVREENDRLRLKDRLDHWTWHWMLHDAGALIYRSDLSHSFLPLFSHSFPHSFLSFSTCAFHFKWVSR